ncbi:phosphotransferase [Iodidimonas sp. SYSU 1G8]|uniref:aminoglycoside phosphotransferase family protein n=1 Tax=Iodidimonas sp. SYSU 1G8 TaxID=3133967 RepID=UPI0031FEABEE
MSREAEIDAFLARVWTPGAVWRPLAADASFRRYFRIEGEPRAVLMDAPPDKEDVRPFMAIGDYLVENGFSAPRVIAADIAEGFLLLEDLGDDTFTRLIARDPATERALYAAAIDVLADLHRIAPPRLLPVRGAAPFELPVYDDDTLTREVLLFPDWYLPARTGHATPGDAGAEFEALWRAVFPLVRGGPDTLVLLDYHADNLMALPGRDGTAGIGLLDFQDGRVGPAAYDLVSLLQDCRRCVSAALEEAMLERYLAARPDVDREAFMTAYWVLGAQRNTKIIGIFTRLWKRDGKPRYPTMIPNLWTLLERGLEHPELEDLKLWFDTHCPADTRRLPLAGHRA